MMVMIDHMMIDTMTQRTEETPCTEDHQNLSDQWSLIMAMKRNLVSMMLIYQN